MRGIGRDFSVSTGVAGFVAVLVGFTSSAAIVFSAAQSLGATPEQTVSWIWALGLGMGITSLGLSLWYRLPVLTAWSTPGAAVLAMTQGVGLAEATDCRRVRLLAYFGEPYAPEGAGSPPLMRCGHCDNCLSPPDTWDASEAARMLLSTVYRVQQHSGMQFGVAHTMDIVRGKRTEKVLQHSHQDLSCFGVGQRYSEAQLRSVLRQLVATEALGVDAQAFPHAVAQHEAGIEHAHHRLGAAEQLAIDVDQDRLVARVRNEIMGTQGCGHGWLLLEQAVGCSAELRCAFALGFRAHQLRFKPGDALVQIDDGEAIEVLPGKIGQQVTLLLGQVGFVEHNRYG